MRCPPATTVYGQPSRSDGRRWRRSSGDGCQISVPLYAESIATHYETLGVHPDAAAEQIRTAYRERARLAHPDRQSDSATDVSIADMARLNEAYRVLSDPGRRLTYDRTLRAAATSGSAAPSVERDVDPDVDPEFDLDLLADEPQRSPLIPDGPARIPWKMMLLVAGIGSAVVLVAAAFTDPPSVEPPDGILRTGSCVQVETNGDVREIACTGAGDLVVDLVIPTDATCPGGFGAYRDRLGLGKACIELDE